ncbi:MAG: MATE family efflux transporter [Spirochaetales bacterium]|nr:MATE family efflux transporter [Spirochaetales bacterium]
MQDIFKDGIRLRSFYSFIYPSIVMIVFMSINYVIDSIMIANFLGITAFAALNLSYPVESLMWGLSVMPAAGASALVAIIIGKGEKEKAGSLFSLICIVALAIGLAYMLIVFIFIEPILNLLGATDALKGACRTYIRLANIGVPFAFVGVMLSFFIRIDGNPKYTLIMNVAGGVTLIVMDFLFMGFFNWGVEGAAIASVLSFIVKAFLGLLYFVKYAKTIKFVKPKWDYQFVRKSLVNGSSEMVSECSTGIVVFVFNLLALKYAGESGVASIGIIMNISYLMTSLYFGYASGVGPLISFYYGAQKEDIINTIHYWSKNMLIISAVLLSFLTFTFAGNLVSIYESSGTEVYNMTITGMRFFAVAMLFTGINIYASGVFTAYGNGIVSAIISFSRSIIFTLSLSFLFTKILGFNGLWFAICSAEFLTIIISVICFYIFRKKYNYNFRKIR